MKVKRVMRPAVLALAVSGLVAACGGSGSSTATGGGQPRATASGTAITIAFSTPITSLDGTVSIDQEYNELIYDSLTKFSRAGKLAPDLATSWSSNHAATVWTFHLRPRVLFSTGTPLTTGDILFSYHTAAANPKSAQQTYVSQIAHASAPNARTVVFKLKAPNSVWANSVSFVPIVSEKAYKAEGATRFATAPVGSGPYAVTSYNQVDTIRLRANTHYWAGPPPIAEVVVKVVPTDTTRLAGLESGQFAAATLDGTDVSTARRAGLGVVSGPAPTVAYLGYDVKAPGLESAQLRRAISYAIDRPAVVSKILDGAGGATDQILAPTVFGYDPSLQPPAYSVAKAKQLVSSSGYHGQPITLTYPNGGGFLPAIDEIAQTTGNFLEAAGIKVKLVAEDSNAFLSDWIAKKLPGIFLFSQNLPSLDGSGGFQYTGTVANSFSSPEVTKLYNEQLSIRTPSERKNVLQKLSRVYVANAYYTPLFYPNTNYVYNKSKVNLPFEASGFLVPEDMAPAS